MQQTQSAPRPSLLNNAVLRRELLTTLRSGKSFLAQFLFVAGVGLIVFFAWPKRAVVPAEQAELSRALFNLFALGQLVLVTVLSPALSAGAMTMEKERKCLDLLLTAPMRATTIPWGKFGASAALLCLIVASSLPILSLCYLLGGVGSGEVLGLYIILLGTALFFTLVGLTCSTFLARTHAALAVSYLLVLPVGGILLLLASKNPGFFELPSAIVTLNWLGGIGFCLGLAMTSRMRRPFPTVEPAAEEEDIREQVGLVIDRTQFPDRLLSPPRSDRPMPSYVNPILLKELRSEIFGRGTLLIRLIIQISCGLSIFVLPCMFTDYEPVYIAYLMAFIMLVAPSFSSIAFSQERERGTMDLLRTTLIQPEQVIWGKFLAAARCTGVLVLLLSIPVGLGTLLAPKVTLLETAQHLTTLAMALAATTAIGLFFSLALRSTFLSMVWTYLTILGLFVGPIATVTILRVYTSLPASTVWLVAPLSPFYAIFATGDWDGREAVAPGAPPDLWGWYLLVYAFITVALLLAMLLGYHRWCEKNAAGQQV